MTGTLSPGQHAGSYNGQDAYNDLLITDGLFGRERTTAQHRHDGDIESSGLYARSADASHSGGYDMNSIVRRLTPLECERLQGFPDNYTDIGDWVDSKGKLHKKLSVRLGNKHIRRNIKIVSEELLVAGDIGNRKAGLPLVYRRKKKAFLLIRKSGATVQEQTGLVKTRYMLQKNRSIELRSRRRC